MGGDIMPSSSLTSLQRTQPLLQSLDDNSQFARLMADSIMPQTIRLTPAGLEQLDEMLSVWESFHVGGPLLTLTQGQNAEHRMLFVFGLFFFSTSHNLTCAGASSSSSTDAIVSEAMGSQFLTFLVFIKIFISNLLSRRGRAEWSGYDR